MNSWYSYSHKLGYGGMAEVLLASQLGPAGFERLVVIKRLLAHLKQDKTARQMFLDEARLAASLKHPNIVEIYEVGREEDEFFIVMEYISGEDLNYILRTASKLGTPIPLPVCVRIMADAASALHCAHTAVDFDGRPRGIIHRDISPSNIIISWDGVTKLVDFGIATANEQNIYTPPGLLRGKLLFLSPERVQQRELDARSDLFSLGVVFYEMLTLRNPFAGDFEAEIVRNIVEKPIDPPSRFNGKVPAQLDDIVVQLLARNLDDRTFSASLLRDQLYEVMDTIGNLSHHRLGEWMVESFAKRHAERKTAERDVSNLARSALTPQSINNLPELFAESGQHSPSKWPGSGRLMAALNVVSAGVEMESGAPSGDSSRTWKLVAAGVGLGVIAMVAVVLVVLFSKPMSSSTAAETKRIEAQPLMRSQPAPEPAPPSEDGPDADTTESDDSENRGMLRTRGSRIVPLLVHFEPPDAEVTVDGTRRPGPSPVRLKLPRGKHTVSLAAPGYTPIERTFKLRPGRDRQMTLRLTREKAKPAKLTIHSKPTGARVAIDGKPHGSTPIVRLPLDANTTHVVQIEQDGYRPYRTRLTPSAGETATIEAALEAKPKAKPKAKPNVQPLVSPRPSPESQNASVAAAITPAPAVYERDVRVPRGVVGNASRGKSLFVKCKRCHEESGSSVGSEHFTKKQWVRYLASTRHGRHNRLSPLFTEAELADVKAFLMDHAADVGPATAAGVR